MLLKKKYQKDQLNVFKWFQWMVNSGDESQFFKQKCIYGMRRGHWAW